MEILVFRKPCRVRVSAVAASLVTAAITNRRSGNEASTGGQWHIYSGVFLKKKSRPIPNAFADTEEAGRQSLETLPVSP